MRTTKILSVLPLLNMCKIRTLQEQPLKTYFQWDLIKWKTCQVSCTHIISEARFSMQKRFVGNIQQFKDITTLAHIYIQLWLSFDLAPKIFCHLPYKYFSHCLVVHHLWYPSGQIGFDKQPNGDCFLYAG